MATTPLFDNLIYPPTQYGSPLMLLRINVACGIMGMILLSFPYAWKQDVPIIGDLVFFVPLASILPVHGFLTAACYRNRFVQNFWRTRFLPPATHRSGKGGFIRGRGFRLKSKRWDMWV